MLILEQLALEDSTVAIQIDSAEPDIASCIWLELNTGHWQALQNPSWVLSGMVGANVDVKIADCPSEELQSRVQPVLRCWAEGCRHLKGGGFSWLISEGRTGKGRDVMETHWRAEYQSRWHFNLQVHVRRHCASLYCKSAGNNPERSGTPGMEKLLAKMERVLMDKLLANLEKNIVLVPFLGVRCSSSWGNHRDTAEVCHVQQRLGCVT
jgi:hypothetical protein